MHCASEALLGLNPNSAVGSIEKGGLEPFRREVEALPLLSGSAQWFRDGKFSVSQRVPKWTILLQVQRRPPSLLQDSRPTSRVWRSNCGIRVEFSLPFAELRRRYNIKEAARAAGNPKNFSKRMREALPNPLRRSRASTAFRLQTDASSFPYQGKLLNSFTYPKDRFQRLCPNAINPSVPDLHQAFRRRESE
jgi:hypothetical protein